MNRAHLFISGFVQGVGFRANTARQARLLSLFGWVRNLPDGQVEAVFEGPEDKIKKMVDWCRQGPILAKVKTVEVSWEKPEGLSGFEVRRSFVYT